MGGLVTGREAGSSTSTLRPPWAVNPGVTDGEHARRQEECAWPVDPSGACGACFLVARSCGSSNPSSSTAALPSLTGQWLGSGSSESQRFRLHLTEKPQSGLESNVSGSSTCLDSSGRPYGQEGMIFGYHPSWYPPSQVDLGMAAECVGSNSGLWFLGRWVGNDLIEGDYELGQRWAGGPEYPLPLRRR